MKRALLIAAAVFCGVLVMGCAAGPSKPGASPRDAEQVRAWGLAHGWKEITPKAATQQQDAESVARGTAAGEVEADRPYQPTAEDRDRGFVVFVPDRNRFRLRDQAPSVGEMRPAAPPFKMTGFAGETEGFPVMVHALRDLKSVCVALQLETRNNEAVPDSDIVIREVVFGPLSLRNTRAKENKFQMWPMWLVPANDPSPLKAGQGRMYWVTVRCPADRPGLYRGSVSSIFTRASDAPGMHRLGDYESDPRIDLTVQPIKLDASLCSWVPVVGGKAFADPALCKQLADHHMTGLSWWWGDYGLRIRKEGQGESAKAVIDPTQLDQLNEVTKAASRLAPGEYTGGPPVYSRGANDKPGDSRGPWILFLGNMIRGHLELRLAGRYKEGFEPPLFPVKLAVIPNIKKTGVQPSSQPAVADLTDSAEMDRRYVEVLQSLAKRAKEKGYPQIIICPYDEPTKYLFKHNAHWCELIHRHVPEIKVLNTPQGDLTWAKNLMPYSDYMDVQGADDAIYDATIKAGKMPLGYSRLTANQTFAQARFDMGLRFAAEQPSVIYFWSLNFGHGDPAAPFNDLIDGDSAARHQFAWAPAKPGEPWVETLVWEAQREGAKDYLLTLMVQRELVGKTSPAVERIRKEFEAFKAEASMHPTKLDARREQLVKWYLSLKE